MIQTSSTNQNSIKQKRKRSFLDNHRNEKVVKESLPNLSKENSPTESPENETCIDAGPLLGPLTRSLFGESVEAKLWGVAARGLVLQGLPTLFPEYTKPGGTDYVYRDFEFWTCGFFPGSLYALLERRKRFTHELAPGARFSNGIHVLHLEHACKIWTESLHQNAHLNSTHDLGFMIMPWARQAYELNHDTRALETIKTGAQTLFSRYSENMKCIRSWDRCVTKKYNFYDMDSDFMVIIDNMMNLDLLFYAASQTSNHAMHVAAVEHARTTARTHIRPDGSTTHLVVFDPKTGTIKHRLTNQGYAHDSCWARGQTWAIAGFAQTYSWTREAEFLDIACKCADYFWDQLPDTRIVPWDFDALRVGGAPQPPDISAAVIATYGMLLIHEALVARGKSSHYLPRALELLEAVCTHHVNPRARFVFEEQIMESVERGTTGEFVRSVDMGGADTILNGATINNYEHAPRRWANHGLVYADYYFLLVGNKLLEMGLAPTILEEYAAK